MSKLGIWQIGIRTAVSLLNCLPEVSLARDGGDQQKLLKLCQSLGTDLEEKRTTGKLEQKLFVHLPTYTSASNCQVKSAHKFLRALSLRSCRAARGQSQAQEAHFSNAF